MCVFVIKFNSLFSIFYYLVALVCFQRVKFFIDVMIILFTFTIVIFNFYFAALLIAFFFYFVVWRILEKNCSCKVTIWIKPSINLALHTDRFLLTTQFVSSYDYAFSWRIKQIVFPFILETFVCCAILKFCFSICISCSAVYRKNISDNCFGIVFLVHGLIVWKSFLPEINNVYYKFLIFLRLSYLFLVVFFMIESKCS